MKEALTSIEQSAPRTGYFGEFGGRFVPETLIAPLDELTAAYEAACADAQFDRELAGLSRDFAGRPTPLYFAARLTEQCGGARIYLKREDLCHTGSHKINNALGQILLARRMGKTRVLAETGAGQHGVASATVAALFGMACVVYMGSDDAARQALNVFRMRLLGAEVREVRGGSRTLKDAINEALRDWVASYRDTYYLLGSALGPHPYPTMVRRFQSAIGTEARAQLLRQHGAMPAAVVACVGGGSNAIGVFSGFLEDPAIQLIGVEAGGRSSAAGEHAARFLPGGGGSPGVLHGARSFVLQDDDGQVAGTHSVSAGLDYPAVGPEHALLYTSGRAQYVSVSDDEALRAFQELSRLEGIIPALESAHAVAYALRLAPQFTRDQALLVNLSGRGDKDVDTVARLLEARA